MTVVSAVSTRPCQGRRAGSNPVGHSQALLAQLGRGASLRRKRFRVRISGGARSEAGKARPRRSIRTARCACPGPPLMEGEPRPGCRAPLLTDARVGTVAFKSPAFLAWEMKSPGGGPRLESGWGS